MTETFVNAATSSLAKQAGKTFVINTAAMAGVVTGLCLAGSVLERIRPRRKDGSKIVKTEK